MSVVQIVSQIINLLGTCINMIGINIKKKSGVLIAFTFGNLCVGISLGLLHSLSGMFVQFIFVIETIINYFYERKNKDSKYPWWMITLYIIVPTIVLTLTYRTLWDIVPISAAIIFALAIVTKDFYLRLLNLLSVVVWIPFNFVLGQYAGALSCFIFTIVNLIAIIRLDCLKKKDKV